MKKKKKTEFWTILIKNSMGESCLKAFPSIVTLESLILHIREREREEAWIHLIGLAMEKSCEGEKTIHIDVTRLHSKKKRN